MFPRSLQRLIDWTFIFGVLAILFWIGCAIVFGGLYLWAKFS